MPSSDEKNSEYLESRALLVLLVVVSLALGWILLPFYGAIMWGSIIALLFAPLYQWLLPRLKRRRTPAALLTLLFVLVIVILPLVLVAISLAQEAALVYQRLQSGELNPALFFHKMFDALPNWITALLDRVGLVNFDVLQRRLTAALAQGSQFIATQALSIGQNTFEFVTSLFIALYLAFFLIRDGDSVARHSAGGRAQA
jgi:predicted PurR-regulated permease PerM